jgi:phosphatidylglycerophosphatase A
MIAVPLSFALNRTAAASLPLALLTLAAFIMGAAWLCKMGEEIFQERDCQRIVIDEIAGFLVANFLSPAGFKPAVAAFLLFRFFDIIKVFPAGRVEQIRGGVGVILDDLIAGFYTFLLLRLLLSWDLL